MKGKEMEYEYQVVVDVWREKLKILSNIYLDNGIFGVVKIIKKLLEMEILFLE